MKNRILAVQFALSIALLCGGCSSSGEGNNNQAPLRVLAKNVLFRTSVANASTTRAEALDVDASTKVLAENVVVDHANMSIPSQNAQDAFENIAPKLNVLLIGTWNAGSYNNGFTGQTGSITFNADGTFAINSGTISVVGGCALQSCSSSSGTWEVINDSVIKMTLPGQEPQFPYPINFNKTRMTLIRSMNMTIFEKI